MRKYREIFEHQNKEKQKWLWLFLFFIFSFFVFGNIQKVSADSDPVGYWKFDDNENDSSGNGNAFTTYNTSYSDEVPVTTFSNTKSLSFDSTDYAVSGPSDIFGDLGGTQPFTESLWIKTTSKPSSGKNSFITMMSDDGQDSVNFDKSIYIDSSGYAHFYAWSGDVNHLHTTKDVADGVWHLLVAAYDGSKVRLYVDGIQYGGDMSLSRSYPGNYFVLSYQMASDSSMQPYAGKLDDVRIYNRALSASEIIELSTQQSSSDQASDNANDSEESVKAKINSWEAYRYTIFNESNCPDRLKLILKGKHFDKDAEVKIGGHEATSVDRQSSQEIVAKFCLTKLINNQTDHKKTITVRNPDTNTEEAEEQIDLDNILYQKENFDSTTTEGIKNIQQKLVDLDYLGSQYVTGIYGSFTAEAVKKFQGDNNIAQTGFVGPLTQAKLVEKN